MHFIHERIQLWSVQFHPCWLEIEKNKKGKTWQPLEAVTITRKTIKKREQNHIPPRAENDAFALFLLGSYWFIFHPAGGVRPVNQEKKNLLWVWVLLECADAPFHYLFNSFWIPLSRGEERRPCQPEYHRGGDMHWKERAARSAAAADSGIFQNWSQSYQNAKNTESLNGTHEKSG